MISSLIPLVALLLSATNAQDITPDCQVVQMIYRSMGGSDTQKSACCEIPGTKCSDGSVTKIRWGDRNLVGSIPSEIGQLIKLEKLALPNNQLTGNIPVEMGNLRKLKKLYFMITNKIRNLQRNQLSGQIPFQLSF